MRFFTLSAKKRANTHKKKGRKNMVPRNEYPRPELRRSEESRLCLNGEWYFEIDNDDTGVARRLFDEERYDCRITVPFVPESRLSGICHTDYMKRVWYARTFVLPQGFDTDCGRVLFHIGAADYDCRVYINGKAAGEHRGGYTPMCFDITDLVTKGENRVNITVYDDTQNPLQPSGKQVSAPEPHGCFYTRCTGIWQSVWLEYVPKNYIKHVKILPDVKNCRAEAEIRLCGDGEVRAEVLFEGETVSVSAAVSREGKASLTLTVPAPKLWDIGQGNLYDVRLTFGSDTATAYFGMRSIEVSGNKVFLNGREIFMRLVLDQGYYPDGIYTAGSAEDFRRDIELSMAAGFNGARMHMKIFEPQFIYEADRAGYLLWGEYPNWGLDISRPQAQSAMLPEWEEELRRDVNHPSVIGWCPFNEAFPGENTAIVKEAVRIAKEYDPTRLVIDCSGWVHSAKTDIYDVHDYEQNPDVFASHYAPLVSGGKVFTNGFEGDTGYDGTSPYFVSEFGGAFFDIDSVYENSAQESGTPWGYGEAPADAEAFLSRLSALCAVLRENPAVCGFCYTQFTDVMQEMNGLYSFDRRAKFPAERLRRAVAGEQGDETDRDAKK